MKKKTLEGVEEKYHKASLKRLRRKGSWENSSSKLGWWWSLPIGRA